MRISAVPRIVLRFIPAMPSKANSLRTCAVCSKNGIYKGSCYWCSISEMPLCVVPCFEKYHTKIN